MKRPFSLPYLRLLKDRGPKNETLAFIRRFRSAHLRYLSSLSAIGRSRRETATKFLPGGKKHSVTRKANGPSSCDRLRRRQSPREVTCSPYRITHLPTPFYINGVKNRIANKTGGEGERTTPSVVTRVCSCISKSRDALEIIFCGAKNTLL